ncbi:MAG: 3-hydroxyacyl-CoA dehydrogenase family protein [Chloroflexota bacterium]
MSVGHAEFHRQPVLCRCVQLWAEHALENEYSIPEVDAITGPLIGRPKTATYRLLDLVGLDVMAHVNENLYEAVPDDPYREMLHPTLAGQLMEKMLANKWLGNKVKQGSISRKWWTASGNSG